MLGHAGRLTGELDAGYEDERNEDERQARDDASHRRNSRKKGQKCRVCTIYGDGAFLQVKTGPTSVSLVQVNYAFDKELTDPEALVDRYTTLTGWAEAALAAGARRSAVVQRFHTAGRVVRGGVEYVFVDRSLSRVVASLQPDVVHVNGIVFPVRTWALRRTLPETAALVVQSHSDGGAIGRAPVLRLAGRLLRGAADAFLFAAAEHADAWRDAGLVGPAQRIHTVMPASTRVEPIARDAARASTGIRGEPALLWVGRLNANKDPHDRFVDAFEAGTAGAPRGDAVDDLRHRGDGPHARRARLERSAVLRERVPLWSAPFRTARWPPGSAPPTSSSSAAITREAVIR